MALILCPECKKDISETTKVCPKCGFGLTPEIVATQKKKNRVERIIMVVSMSVMVVSGVILFVALSCPVNHSENSGAPKEWKERLWVKSPNEATVSPNEATVNAWLEEQRKGKSGNEYWATSFKFKGKAMPVTPVMFYAVRSWKIVDTLGDKYFTVRIESSTKGGQPIIKLWEMCLDDDGKIWYVHEKID